MAARSASCQWSAEMVSTAPITTESTTTAAKRYRLGTSSPISMLAIRRGNTSENTECRTAYKLTNANNPAIRNDDTVNVAIVATFARHTSCAASEAYQRCSV